MKPSEPSRRDVLRLSHPPLPIVRMGFIGLGNRGLMTLERYMQIEGTEITALCDLRETNLCQAQQILKRYGHPGPPHTQVRMAGKNFVRIRPSIWYLCVPTGLTILLWPCTP